MVSRRTLPAVSDRGWRAGSSRPPAGRITHAFEDGDEGTRVRGQAVQWRPMSAGSALASSCARSVPRCCLRMVASVSTTNAQTIGMDESRQRRRLSDRPLSAVALRQKRNSASQPRPAPRLSRSSSAGRVLLLPLRRTQPALRAGCLSTAIAVRRGVSSERRRTRNAADVRDRDWPHVRPDDLSLAWGRSRDRGVRGAFARVVGASPRRSSHPLEHGANAPDHRPLITERMWA
jgi:hypothetical protein